MERRAQDLNAAKKPFESECCLFKAVPGVIARTAADRRAITSEIGPRIGPKWPETQHATGRIARSGGATEALEKQRLGLFRLIPAYSGSFLAITQPVTSADISVSHTGQRP